MKHKIIAIAILFLALASCKKSKDLNQQPKLGATPQVKLGKAEKFELPNGLKVVMVENHKLPRVSVSLQLDNKPYFEGDKVGTSSFMGALLGTGTKSITKDEFIEQIDFMGASANFSSGGASAASLKKYFPEVLKLLADGVKNPVFNQKELDKQKALSIEGLKSSEKSIDAIASRVQATLLYGNKHPYGEYLTEETIKKISLQDIKDNYNTYYKPNNAYMAIVGDINTEETKKLVTQLFSDWQKGKIPASNFEKPTNAEKTEINFIDVPNAVQSNVVIANNIDLKLGDKDFYAVKLANNILGGGMSGRLFKNLREDKAYTYGAYSSVSSDRYGALFKASSSVRNTVTDSAIVEFRKELKKIRNEKVTDEELKITKAIYTGNFVMNVEKPETAASFALNIAKHNLPEDYYEKYLENINSVTIEDIQNVAKKYFQVDNSKIVIVGKGTDVIPNLEKTGIPIKYFDRYANPTEAVKIEKVDTGLTAESIVNKYFKAIGGLNKVKAIKTIVSNSEVNMQGQVMKVTTKTAFPNKVSTTFDVMGQKQRQVFDGKKGFMEMQGRKIDMSDEEVKMFEKETSPFIDFGYVNGIVKGIEDVNDKKTYVISIRDKRVFYDKESGLKLKEVIAGKNPETGEPETTATLFQDYKPVNGIKLPHTIIQDMGQDGKMELKVKGYLLNKGVTDKDFQ